MSKKPTFELRRRGGGTETTPYTPLMVIAGTQAHKLALHKDSLGDWVVSHPPSGAAVVRRITGWYKGCPVSSKGLTQAQARQLALAEVDALIQRVGAARFNDVLKHQRAF